MEAYFGENKSNPLNNLNEKGLSKVADYVSLLEGFNKGEYLNFICHNYWPPLEYLCINYIQRALI